MFAFLKRIFPAAPNYSVLAIDRISVDLKKDIPLLEARLKGIDTEIVNCEMERDQVLQRTGAKINELNLKRTGYENKLKLVQSLITSEA